MPETDADAPVEQGSREGEGQPVVEEMLKEAPAKHAANAPPPDETPTPDSNL